MDGEGQFEQMEAQIAEVLTDVIISEFQGFHSTRKKKNKEFNLQRTDFFPTCTALFKA